MSSDQQQSWRTRAACLGLDTAVFFPTRGESTNTAKAICATCPVNSACADFAMASGQRFGVWGGTTERARRRDRSKAARTRRPITSMPAVGARPTSDRSVLVQAVTR